MLRKVPYNHILDIRNLHHLLNKEQEIQFIAPGPQQADSLRSIIQRSSLKNNYDVITISKFVQNELAQPITRKSDLMKALAVAWKKFFRDNPYPQFERGLRLLTDLRSFTLDINLVSSILEDFDPELQKVIQVFWKLCDDLPLYDEQRAYYELSEKWRFGESIGDSQRHFIFWGFEFFSNLQIALLEALALNHQVDILIPAIVLENASNFDWPLWIKGEMALELGEKKIKENPIQIVRFPKNHLNGAILNLLEKVPMQQFDIVLAQKDIEIEHVLEIPVRNHFFKSPIEILKTPFLRALLEIHTFIGQTTSSVIAYCQDRLEQFIEKQNFREIKNWHLLRSFLEDWGEQSDENNLFERFDWELIKQVLPLDHPRLFYVPILDKRNQGRILTLNERSIYSDIPTLIIGLAKYQGPKLERFEYTLETLDRLATIGPIKRTEFEFLFIQQAFNELLENPQAYLFLEEGLLEESFAWSELLGKMERKFKEIPLVVAEKERPNISFLKNSPHDLGKISPTKLQSYIDCPQHYYYQYVERIHTYPELKNELLPNERGLIEHEIIGKYLYQRKTFEREVFSQICHDEISQFCQQKEKNLDRVSLLAITEEIERYALNGIQYLIEFLQGLDEYDINFEVQIEDQRQHQFVGKVDCVIKSKDGDYLFDFKRSSLSIPSKRSVDNYEKIQLWYYAAHLPKSYNWKGMGYINLKDPERSRLWMGALNPIIEKYFKREEDFLQQLMKEKIFPPRPRSADICRYCTVRLVCPRGEVL